MSIADTAAAAKAASIPLAAVPADRKNAALDAIATALSAAAQQIIAANKADLAAAEKDNLAAHNH